MYRNKRQHKQFVQHTRKCCESLGCREKKKEPEEPVADSVSDKLLRIRSVGISEG